MALRDPIEDVLMEALRSRHKEPFERSLGRAVRHHGGTASDYIDLIARVRERARSNRVELSEAARRLAYQV